jgi:hypothetical protein
MGFDLVGNSAHRVQENVSSPECLWPATDAFIVDVIAVLEFALPPKIIIRGR